MNSHEDFTSMWAILPPSVRYDPELSPSAKLLFAEIAAKTNQLGYCWAYNKYFAGVLTMSADRVSDLIKQLEKHGYISIEYDKGRDNQDKRHIYLTPKALLPGVSAKTPRPPGENAETGIGEKAEPLKENNKEKMGYKKPGYMPLEIFRAICQWCGDDGELMLAWMQYADMRQRTRHPIGTVATVERACKKIETLADKAGGSRAYKLGLLHKATDASWRGFYPLTRGDEGFMDPAAAAAPNEEAEVWL